MSTSRSISTTLPAIGFIGLGVMGFPMAGHLAAAGYPLTVFNRRPEKAHRWQERHGGRATECLEEVAEAEVVISCIGNDADLQAIYLGSHGLLQRLRPGTLVIDHTTASADLAERLAAAAGERGISFLDAPVSGGEQGAINGQLTIMCGGERADFERAEPILACYARSARLLGSSGAGQKTKMVNQIAIAGLLQGLAEAMAFAARAGLPTAEVIEVISKGAAQSWQMENRHKTMLAGHYDHGFAIDLMRKDLGIVLAEARRNGATLPVTALVDQFYADLQRMGGGRWDTSALLARLLPPASPLTPTTPQIPASITSSTEQGEQLPQTTAVQVLP